MMYAILRLRVSWLRSLSTQSRKSSLHALLVGAPQTLKDSNRSRSPFKALFRNFGTLNPSLLRSSACLTTKAM
jgi:hypothetical protein